MTATASVQNPLARTSNGRVTFDLAAIMRRAHAEGRFALRMCRTVAERRASFSRWLTKAWAIAKREAAELVRHAQAAAATRRAMAARAAEAVALVAAHGGAEGIRQAIKASITASISTAPASRRCAPLSR